MALVGTSQAVVFTATAPTSVRFTSTPVTFAALAAPTAYLAVRVGSTVQKARVGRRVGSVIQWLSPPLP